MNKMKIWVVAVIVGLGLVGAVRGDMTFTVSDEYDFVPVPLGYAIGSDGVTGTGLAGDLSGVLSSVEDLADAFGVGLPAGGDPTLFAIWEFSVDNPNDFDAFFTDTGVHDFHWEWTLTTGAFGVTADIQKTGTFADLFPFPSPALVPVTVVVTPPEGLPDITLDLFAAVVIDAPTTPGFFEIGRVMLVGNEPLPAAIPSGLFISAEIEGGTGRLVIPEPGTGAAVALGGLAAPWFVRGRRRGRA